MKVMKIELWPNNNHQHHHLGTMLIRKLDVYGHNSKRKRNVKRKFLKGQEDRIRIQKKLKTYHLSFSSVFSEEWSKTPNADQTKLLKTFDFMYKAIVFLL